MLTFIVVFILDDATCPSLTSLFAVLCRLWRQPSGKEQEEECTRSWVFFLALASFESLPGG